MAQETTEPQGRSGRPKWMGYAQLILILAAIGVASVLRAGAQPRGTRPHFRPGARPGQANRRSDPAGTPTEQALRVDLTGAVTLHGKVRVTSEVGGRVVWVSPNFRNGGSIAANEAIIRIDPAEYELEARSRRRAGREGRRPGQQIENGQRRRRAVRPRSHARIRGSRFPRGFAARRTDREGRSRAHARPRPR